MDKFDSESIQKDCQGNDRDSPFRRSDATIMFLGSCLSSLSLDLPLVICWRAFGEESVDMHFVWNDMIWLIHAADMM